MVLSLSTGTWTDAETGLMWVTKDNGQGLDWNAAVAYCRDLNVDGYTDWGLPTIRELRSLYLPQDVQKKWHEKGGIELSSCCMWGWSRVNPSPQAVQVDYNFSLGDKPGFSVYTPDHHRALCVRGKSPIH
jgi:hypothetical protein